MGDAMNPLSPEKILRNLENGFFMTHREQEEAAQYIRQLQQENLTLLGKRDFDIEYAKYSSTPEYQAMLAKLKEKNHGSV
jgi:NAD-specific glutamate dehydrogenase